MVMNDWLKLEDVKSLIKIESGKGKHIAQIKVLQYEKIPERKYPKMLCQKLGFTEIAEQLKTEGYSVDFKKTDRQVSSKVVKNQTVCKSRDLHTTNMIIKW